MHPPRHGYHSRSAEHYIFLPHPSTSKQSISRYNISSQKTPLSARAAFCPHSPSGAALRAAFQDKTETDRGKRFDINKCEKSAKEIFMREGYFRIEFYKRDGAADAECAARVFGYCAEHCGDWFTGDFIDENEGA